MHAILATGMLLPSDPGLAGTWAFTDRGGVYLHRPINRHLAENESSLTRYGTKHIFIKPCIEVLFDAEGNMRAGKRTNQLIQTFESVKIVTVHLRIATKENLRGVTPPFPPLPPFRGEAPRVPRAPILSVSTDRGSFDTKLWGPSDVRRAEYSAYSALYVSSCCDITLRGSYVYLS